ncbi:hypothetical protein F2Q68_00035868 [Brassica cretica]|uniref:Uncharacterized protein n=1 Tax=Brassica cretica TaxID=69181 RepID=A0A8S9H7V4_BRACR|nr:hypothetical protein F2Q68_00035868 [Brassica cretica]
MILMHQTLYIPLMAFGTCVVLAGLSLGVYGNFDPCGDPGFSRFSSEALNWLFVKGMMAGFCKLCC